MSLVYERSAELFKQGRNAEALREIDAGIACAEKENQPAWIWIGFLCGFGFAAAQHLSNFSLVVRYCERVLACDPVPNGSKELALYAFANAMFRLGEPKEAKKDARRSYALVQRPKNETKSGLLELLTDRWPKISDWQA